MKRVFSSAFQWLLLSITFLLIGLIALFALIQTPWGKQKLAEGASSLLKSYGIKASFSHIQGILPFDCVIEDVVLEDSQGTHVFLHQVRASFSFFSLLRQEIALSSFGVEKIRLENKKLKIAIPSYSLQGKVVLKDTSFKGSFECFDVSHETVYAEISFAGDLQRESTLRVHILELPPEFLAAGSLDLIASFQEKEIKAMISSSSLTIDSFLLPFEAHLSFLREPSEGTLVVHAESGDLPILTSVHFGVENGSILNLSDIDLAVGKEPLLQISGNLSLCLNNFLVRGNCYLTSSHLSELLPLDIGGKCALNLSFSEDGQHQDSVIKGVFEECYFQNTSFDSLFIFADLKSLYNGCYGSMESSVIGMKTPYGSLSLGHLEGCKGSHETAWQGALACQGVIKEPFEAKSSFSWGKGALSLKTFSANALNLPILLREECAFIWGPKNVQISPFFFDVAEGAFQGSFSLNAQALEARLEMERFPLPLLALLSPKFSLQGSLSLKGSLSGTEENLQGNLEASLGKAVLTNFSQEDTLSTKGSLLAHLSEQTATMHLHLDAQDLQFIDLAASIPIEYSLRSGILKPDFHLPMSGSLTAEGHLEELFDFIDLGFHYVTGLVTADLLASGSLSSPFLQGGIDWSYGSYANYLIGAQLSNVSAHLEAEKDLFEITSIKAEDGKGGSLTGDGQIKLSWKEKLPYHLALSLSNLTTLDFNLLEAKLDGSLYISGSFLSAMAQGNLWIQQGCFHIPDALPYDLPSVPFTFINRPATQVRPEKIRVFPFSTDLTVTTTDTVSVEGKGLKSEWKGTLHITGTNLNLAAGGKLKLVSGEYVFAGRRFKLSEGEIFFADEKTKTAYINLKGVLNLGDLEVTASLYGPLTHPNLTFQSNPNLPTSSILARVLFNKDISDINQFEAVQLATTLMSLSGGNGDGILENIRKSIGVDRLTLTSSGKNGEGVAVQIGKYLTKGVMVTLSQSATSTQVIVEVEIGKGFIFQAETQEVEEGKFSLKWRHTY